MWAGIGINYGHQAIYDTTQVEQDFVYLQSIGVTRLRIFMPGYNSTTNITNCQDMIQRALNHHFSVIWGVTTGTAAPTLTATIWSAYKTYVVNTLAPWAQTAGLAELSLGNEADYEADGTTLTAATVRSDVRSMAATIKANGYTGKLVYSTTILTAIRDPWISEGIGQLDYIAWNSYDTLTNFTNRNPIIVSAFGNQTYISEFGSITHGQSDYASEQAYYTDVVNRITAMRNSGISRGYFFCWRDGGHGVPVNSFGLVQTSSSGANWAHYALRAVNGVRLYAMRVLGRPLQFGIGKTDPLVDSVTLSESIPDQGTMQIPAESIALAETVTFTGKPAPSESVQLSESIASSSNVASTTNTVQLLETITFANSTLLAPDVPSLLEILGPLVQILAISESVQLSDSFGGPPTVSRYALRVFGSPVHFGPSSIVIPADSVTLTEQVALLGISTSTQSDETVAISEDFVCVGQPQIAAEQVQLSEDTITFSNVASIINAAQLLETIALSGVTQLDPDVASLLEVSNPTGLIQNDVESVQLSDSVTIPPTINRYALRVFGSPVIHGSSSIVIPADSVTLTEQVVLAATAHFVDSASVTVSDVVASVGQAQIAADNVQLSEILVPSTRYALRVFGAPVRYASAGSTKTLQIVDVLSVSLSDSSVISGQPTIIDGVALDDADTFSENMALTESVGVSEVTAETGTFSLAESAQIDESLQLVNVPSLSDSVQALELLSFVAGTSQFTESAQIDESLASVSATSFTESLTLTDQAAFTNLVSPTESVTLQETNTLTGATQFVEPAQIDEIPASVSLTSFIESVALADQTDSSGTPTFSETVSLDETSTYSGATSLSSEAVQLLEVLTQLVIMQFSEAVALLESSTYVGQPQIVESIQSSETITLANTSQISAEATQLSDILALAGLPSFVESVSATDLSFAALSATLSFTESLQLLDTMTLLGTSTLASESVSVSDAQTFLSTLALLEAAQLLEAVTLSGIASSPSEAVSLTDALSFQSALQALIENILLADLTSFTETLGITESVQVSDSQPLFAGVVASLESAQISETIQQASSIAIVIATVVSDQTSLAGALLQIEALLLSDTFTSQTFVSLQVPADSVALSEIFALLPPINMTFYVRKGNVIFYVRKGNATLYTRKGNATFYERE